MRINLPEIEDQAWFPESLRDAMTGFLQVMIEATGPYAPAAPILDDLIRSENIDRISDLASGAGGPWPVLIGGLRAHHPQLQVTLSDLYPNLRAAASLENTDGLTYHRAPATVTEPPDRTAARTMFSSMHHFRPEDLRAIFEAAQRDRVPFFGAEATHRSLRGVLLTVFIPLFVLLFMPRVRPRRFVPLLLTYVPPLLPLLIWWDGFASTLRTYSAAELHAIIRQIEAPGYSWQVEEISHPRAPIPLTTVIGRPV